jgi:hypothetical protein
VYDGYTTQLGYMTDGSVNYNDYLRGYFFAPVNGVYNFETVVDDNMIVLMSAVQNSSNPANMRPIMRLNSFVTFQQDPYNTPGVNNTVSLNLTRGYYYMEILSQGLGSANFYYVSVSMPPKITPSSPSPVANPTWKI